jgi:deferrochelatase/peroxidase EfeB
MGRWHDGVPLIDRPFKQAQGDHGEGESPPDDLARSALDHGQPHAVSKQRTDSLARQYGRDTDLNFGVDDPQGLFCPFGAHIRRVNPRGSLQPGDDSELTITNRHRIIRRGRSYQNGAEKGLLFVALCADLERQYEFVQQTWMNSPGFAGLSNEPDPAISIKRHPASARFTIPTSAGSLTLAGGKNFITVRGGGYFFLPSRSALAYLADLNRRAAPTAGKAPSQSPAF